jgi:hypothetical protein
MARRLRRCGLVVLLAGSLAVAGCGGGDPLVYEVPSPYADAPIPESSVTPPAAADGASSTATPTPTPTETPASGTGATGSTGTSGTTPSSSSTGTESTGTAGGGAAAPADGGDSATNDTTPPAGSNAQKFEDFCAQNPGAC